MSVSSASDWLSPREAHLRSLLRISEETLNVTYLAETDLRYIEPTMTVGDAKRWLVGQGFDAAPVREPRPHRFIAFEGDAPTSARVDEVARVIDADHLATSTLSLADGVALLRERPSSS